MKKEINLRQEFEKEWGGLPSQFEVDENGYYENHTIDLAWDMYLLATQKKEKEIESLNQDKLVLTKALEFYANKENWYNNSAYDGGKHARTILKELYDYEISK